MRTVLLEAVVPQHVAFVHVTVQADRRDGAGAVERRRNRVEPLLRDAGVDGLQVRRQSTAGEKIAAWLLPKAFDVERRPRRKWRAAADRMHPSEESSDPLQHLFVVQQ